VDTFEARLTKDDEVYYISKLSTFVATAAPDHLVVNRLSDFAEGQTDFCDAAKDPLQRQATQEIAAGRVSATAVADSCIQLEIAGAGDHTLFQSHGVFGTEAKVFEVINLAEGIFMSEFGLPFTVTGNVVSIVDDPYNSTDSKALLASFKEHWNELDVPIKRDLAMLVSGKNLDGGTKGRAFIGVAGFPESAYGVVQSPGTDHLDFVVAHEIGHSLDADHDDDGCIHLLASLRWVMCSWVGTKDFSGTSRSAINNYLNNHLDLFSSEYTLSTSAFNIDGNLTEGELHAGGTIATEDYSLNQPDHNVTLVSRKMILLKPLTRIVNGARLRCRIDPSLDCTSF